MYTIKLVRTHVQRSNCSIISQVVMKTFQNNVQTVASHRSYSKFKILNI